MSPDIPSKYGVTSQNEDSSEITLTAPKSSQLAILCGCGSWFHNPDCFRFSEFDTIAGKLVDGQT
jgi:hypothetical protein